MSPDELRSEIAGELEQMRIVVRELVALRRDAAGRAPTLREKVAAAGFLAQFYNGVENILKRISKHHGVALPEGQRWHAELFDRFRRSSASGAEFGLPVLFDAGFAAEMAKYRGFRHVTRVSYAVELRWEMMAEGIDRVQETFDRFEQAVSRYLNDPGA